MDKQMRKLSRADLLEMLIEQSTELEALRAKLEETESALKTKEIRIAESGTMAEATLRLNGVFEAAQRAGEQYLENIRMRCWQQEELCIRVENEALKDAERRLAEAEKKAGEIEKEAKIKSAEMTARAKAEAREYLQRIRERLEACSGDRAAFKEMIEDILRDEK